MYGKLQFAKPLEGLKKLFTEYGIKEVYSFEPFMNTKEMEDGIQERQVLRVGGDCNADKRYRPRLSQKYTVKKGEHI